MKRLILTLTLLLPFLGVYSQKNKDAKYLLDNATALLQKEGGIKTSFYSSTYKGGIMEGDTKGVLYLKGEKFVLETNEMKTWYDGKYQWSLIFEMEEVNVSEPTEEELQEINPYQLLKLYKKGYSYSLSGNVKNGAIEVLLKAQDKSRNYQQIKVWINQTSYEPNLLEVMTKDNRIAKIQIKEFSKGIKLSDALFRFNNEDYPDADIIDLR